MLLVKHYWAYGVRVRTDDKVMYLGIGARMSFQVENRLHSVGLGTVILSKG